ncbi:hypothetical protein E3N88_25016 [Mikania micrantha]|uniref:Uncharacterized protein n=1 Tax=Mikania micrantha TaxID=192012 RepID=A0A5N6N6F6_9ASTR|nr:hypothetical protein E3N88_25016 [Mikania micrantha]
MRPSRDKIGNNVEDGERQIKGRATESLPSAGTRLPPPPPPDLPSLLGLRLNQLLCDLGKAVKGNLVVARGKKKGSLYMVEIPPEGVSPVLVKGKVRLCESRVQKKVTFAKGVPRARGKIHNEPFVRKGSVKPVNVGGCRNSGSTKKNRVSVAVPSVGSQFISDASGVTVELQCEQAEIGNNESLAGLVVTDELKLRGASTGLQKSSESDQKVTCKIAFLAGISPEEHLGQHEAFDYFTGFASHLSTQVHCAPNAPLKTWVQTLPHLTRKDGGNQVSARGYRSGLSTTAINSHSQEQAATAMWTDSKQTPVAVVVFW